MGVTVEQRDDGMYRVETGAGLISSVTREPGARNAQVTIKATHSSRVVEPVTGWVDTHDAGVHDVLVDGSPTFHAGRVVEYRIETHRRAGAPAVPADTPLEKMAKRDKVREVVMLRVAGDTMYGAGASGAPAATTDTVLTRPGNVDAGEERRKAHASFDLAEACAVLAYQQLVAQATRNDLAKRVGRLAGVLLDIAIATRAPYRAVAALPAILEARRSIFGNPTEWREAVEADLDAVLGALSELVQKAAAA